MERSAQQRARNESLFRDANERIERSALGMQLADRPIPFVCECETESCTTIVRLVLAEYEEIRAGPTRFVVSPAHESPEDRVIAERARFTIVEKTGEEAELVDASYPRR